MNEDQQNARTENPLYTLSEGVMEQLALVAHSFAKFADPAARNEAAVVFQEIESFRKDVDTSIYDELMAEYNDLPEEARAMCGDLGLSKNLTLADASAVRSRMDAAKTRAELDRVQEHAEEFEREQALEQAREHAEDMIAKHGDKYLSDEDREHTAEIDRQLAEAKRRGDQAAIDYWQGKKDEDTSYKLQKIEDGLRADGHPQEADKVKDAKETLQAERAKDAERDARFEREQAERPASSTGEPGVTSTEQALLAELGVLPVPAAPMGTTNDPAVGRA